MWPHRWQPTRLRCPWDPPGENTGVGCHLLLQSIKVKSESEVAQSCPTLCDPMDCSLTGSPVHGIFQARVLEWVAIAFSKVPAYMTTKETLSQWLHLFSTIWPSLRNWKPASILNYPVDFQSLGNCLRKLHIFWDTLADSGRDVCCQLTMKGNYHHRGGTGTQSRPGVPGRKLGNASKLVLAFFAKAWEVGKSRQVNLLFWASLIAQLVKDPPPMQETPVRFLGREDLLEKGKATHANILAWRILWTGA